jgi:hypothetical protein
LTCACQRRRASGAAANPIKEREQCKDNWQSAGPQANCSLVRRAESAAGREA